MVGPRRTRSWPQGAAFWSAVDERRAEIKGVKGAPSLPLQETPDVGGGELGRLLVVRQDAPSLPLGAVPVFDA